jgi:hypothetical protein
MNWVLGHIVSGRNDMLKYLPAETLWDEETNDLYKRESEPILGPESPYVDY